MAGYISTQTYRTHSRRVKDFFKIDIIINGMDITSSFVFYVLSSGGRMRKNNC